MKILILVLLLIPSFAHSQSTPSERWKFLFEDRATNTKTYIDTQTTEHLDYSDGRKNVYSIWLKSYSDFTNGKYHEETIKHMVISMDTKQIGVKSFVKKKDDINIDDKQFLFAEWKDIVPETNAEALLNYCKSFNK